MPVAHLWSKWIIPDESNIKNIYGELTTSVVYLQSKPWHNLNQHKIINFNTEKTLSYFFVILAFPFS